ncbi:MAG: tRNA (adenosine(37)-N6)-dimethylallyltransferase MiaA [Bacteroidales bacterium]|nr:tRNA (adenosine(37)-N6)-dimethylallyltransferase MiaA [Bacteroidales bacterium]
MLNKTLIVILGSTGIGKTNLSIELALMLNTVIISSDSRQIYKELKIGTAAPAKNDLAKAKHYMIGNKSIHDYYSAGIYELEVLKVLDNIFKTKNTAILAGGSGMYIDAVCKGIDIQPDIETEIRRQVIKQYETEGIESLRFDLKKFDPEHYKFVDLNNPQRIMKALEICIQTGKTYTSFLKNKKKNRDFNIIKIGLQRNREELYERINKRVDIMLEQGLVKEAKQFYKYKKLNSLNTVGYKELFAYFNGEHDLKEAIRLIKRNTRRYAKRQITWFKRDNEISWFHPDEKEKIISFVNERIAN